MTPGVFAGPGGMKKAAPEDGQKYAKDARLVHSGCWSVKVVPLSQPGSTKPAGGRE